MFYSEYVPSLSSVTIVSISVSIIIIIIIIIYFVFAAKQPTTSSSTATSNFVSGQISTPTWTNREIMAMPSYTSKNYMCIDQVAATTAATNGTPLQMYRCNSSPSQQWTYGADKTLKNGSDSSCLNMDIPTGRINRMNCNGTTNQKWNTTYDTFPRNGQVFQSAYDKTKCIGSKSNTLVNIFDPIYATTCSDSPYQDYGVFPNTLIK
jgi:hypothetical protein